MTNPGRPLSPHLSVFRWPITMALSILHRAAGVAMSVGLIAYAVWLMAAAGSPELYGWLQEFFSSILGQLMLIGWSFAFFLHLANGIRHLVWDTGRGFELETAAKTGHAVPIAAGALTILAWVVGYAA